MTVAIETFGNVTGGGRHRLLDGAHSFSLDHMLGF